MLRTVILGWLIGCLILLSLACSVPLYKVKPIPKNVPTETGQTASNNGLEVTADALIEDEKSFERFDTNLPLAGIVAVDVTLANRSDHTSNSLKFELQDATGKKFSPLEPKNVLKRVMDFEGVRLYPIAGKEQTLEQLQAITLPKKITLDGGEEKRGTLFFRTRQDVAKLKGLSLLVKGGKETITLPLH